MNNPSDLVITRTIDATPQAVFDAWTNCADFKQWWGPEGYTCPSCEIDARVGGKSLACMRSPDGKDFWSGGVFKEFRSPDKIVTTDYFADSKGNMMSPADYGMDPTWPKETVITITFEAVDGGTRMTMRQGPMPEGHMKEECEKGWNGSFDKLEAFLSKKQVGVS